jgi:hypothetical protein
MQVEEKRPNYYYLRKHSLYFFLRQAYNIVIGAGNTSYFSLKMYECRIIQYNTKTKPRRLVRFLEGSGDLPISSSPHIQNGQDIHCSSLIDLNVLNIP